MKIDTLVVGILEANCYILTKNNKALIVDPGAEYKKIKTAIGKNQVLGVLITHHHEDHIGALKELLQDYPVEVYKKNNLEEKNYKVGPFCFDLIYTPGHTSDSVSYHFKQEKTLFTGDFIFRGTVGRCDLPTGDCKAMDESLEKIKKLPQDTIIYSGHGFDTTLKQECITNPYF